MNVRAVTVPRAALALTAGAIVGALLTTLLLIAPGLVTEFGVYRTNWSRILVSTLIISIASFAYFLIGLVLVGVPTWYLAHRLDRTGWSEAMIVGAILMFVVVMLLNAGPTDGLSLEASAWMSAVGAVVGLVVWWIAYRS
jgi:hypothetical protein